MAKFTPKQSRIFARILNFMKVALYFNYQLLSITLTSASEERGLNTLTKDFKELRRRIRLELGYKLGFLSVKTSEGQGVVHMIMAVKGEGKKAVWIHYYWLAETWKQIHGAFMVDVQRVPTKDGKLQMHAARYIAGQGNKNKGKKSAGEYIASQDDSLIVHVDCGGDFLLCSMVGGFRAFKKIAKMTHEVSHYEEFEGREIEVRYIEDMGEFYDAWFNLLATGTISYRGVVVSIIKRKVVVENEIPF